MGEKIEFQDIKEAALHNKVQLLLVFRYYLSFNSV